jgi:hypothetical protein
MLYHIPYYLTNVTIPTEVISSNQIELSSLTQSNINTAKFLNVLNNTKEVASVYIIVTENKEELLKTISKFYKSEIVDLEKVNLEYLRLNPSIPVNHYINFEELSTTNQQLFLQMFTDPNMYVGTNQHILYMPLKTYKDIKSDLNYNILSTVYFIKY